MAVPTATAQSQAHPHHPRQRLPVYAVSAPLRAPRPNLMRFDSTNPIFRGHACHLVTVAVPIAESFNTRKYGLAPIHVRYSRLFGVS